MKIEFVPSGNPCGKTGTSLPSDENLKCDLPVGHDGMCLAYAKGGMAYGFWPDRVRHLRVVA